MAVGISEFLDRLEATGIVDDATMDEIRTEAESAGDAEKFVKSLHKSGRLTAHQAKLLWKNRGNQLAFGNYVVEDELGRGGMGVVLKARHKRMQRLVAIKVLPAELVKDADAIARFQREVVAAAQLTHTNIVGAYDADEFDGRHVLVMEYVDGRDLSSMVKKKGRLSVDQAVDCVVQAARGLEYAHGKGVVHRDIKPANLLLDSEGTVKILDMGLARFSDAADVGTQAELTGTGTIMGTVDYMSPEQAMSTKNADERSDVYSLGITLYYLLTARPAYGGDSLMARMMAHANQPVPKLQQERPDVPEAVQDVFAKMVAKQADDRYQTMGEVIAALEATRTSDRGESVAASSSDSVKSDKELSRFLKQIDADELSDEVEGTEAYVATATEAAAADAEATVNEGTVIATGISETVKTDRKLVVGPPLTDRLPNWFRDWRVLFGAGGGLLALVLVIAFSIGGGGGGVEPGPSDGSPTVEGGLVFRGRPDRVSVPSLTIPPGDVDLCIEGYVTMHEPVRRQALFGFPYGFNVAHHEGDGFVLLAKPSISSKVEAEVGRKTHVAAVRHRDEFRLYVDGKRTGSAKFDGKFAGGKAFDIGYFLKGVVHEVRVSTVFRYDADFTPPARHTKDDDTLALYHFDEGAGDVVADASGNGHDGKITGAEWLKAGEPQQPSPQMDEPPSPPPSAVAPFEADEARAHQRAWANFLGFPVEREVELPGGSKLTMVLIPPGEFLMGSTADEQAAFLRTAKAANDEWAIGRIPGEGPQHRVRITRPLYLGKHEVTQAQWQAVMGNNPSRSKSPDHPVEMVAWDDVQAFLEKLNGRDADDATFVLPTEAQWEYACRAGSATTYHGGDGTDDLREQGWFLDNSGGRPHPVGQLKPNAFGLHDVHGNVWEWCADWFADGYYGQAPLDDPTGPAEGTSRVFRGGGWGYQAGHCRSAVRDRSSVDTRNANLGFRLAMTVAVPKPTVPPASTGLHALEFDGVDDRVDVSIGATKLGPEFTLEAWIDSDQVIGQPTTTSIVTWRGDVEAQIHERIADGEVRQIGGSLHDRDGYIHARTERREGRHHVAVVRRAGEFVTYVDGRKTVSGRKQGGAARAARDDGRLTIGARFGFESGNYSDFFLGRIDEVRVSNVARYDDDFIPKQRFDTDANTLALYHFDEGEGDVLADASGHGHHGKIVGAKWVRIDAPNPPPPAGTFALEFDASEDVVRLPALLEGTKFASLTAEAWVTFDAKPPEKPANVFAAAGFQKGIYLARMPEGGLGCLVGEPLLASDRPIVAGRPSHVALVVDSRAVRLYLDGVRVGSTLLPEPFVSASDVVVLGGKAGNSFQGRLHEARLSATARYDENFTPTRRFPPDEQTLALYHVDEGEGDVLKDASGKGHDGKIVGAKWVRVGEADPVPPVGRSVLRFDRHDVVTVESLKLDRNSPYTIEAVFKREPDSSQVAVFAGHPNLRGDRLGLYVGTISRGQCLLAHRTSSHTVNAGLFDKTDGYMHVAMVHTGRELLGFRDGKLIDRRDTTDLEIDPPLTDFVIGQGLSGRFELLHVSSVARYTKDFEPRTEAVPDTNTLALYRFDGGEGDVLRDASGNGHDGKITGAAWVRIAEPVEERVLHLDGNAFVDVPTLRLGGGTPLTVEAEVRLDALGEGMVVSDAEFAGLALKIHEGRWTFDGYQLKEGRFKAAANAPAKLGRWSHVAAVFDGKNARLYVDGRPASSRVPIDGIKPSKLSVRIGANPENNPTIVRHGLRGAIRNVRISKTARYTEAYDPPTRPIPDLHTLAQFRLDEGAGDVVKDASGNGHHGRIVGARWVASTVTPAGFALEGFGPPAAKSRVADLPRFLKPNDPFTVEMTITPRSHADAMESRSLWTIAGILELKQHERNLTWQRNNPGAKPSLEHVFLKDCPLGRPMRLAAVSTGTETRLFVDGKLLGTRELQNPLPAASVPITLLGWGDERSNYGRFDGTVDDVRISKVARYDADYEPPARLEADANTIALYRCDEGRGAVLVDSSGRGNDGTIVNAKWVREEPPGSAPPLAIAPFDAAAAKAHQEAWARHLRQPVVTTNSIGMKLAVVPPGTFEMGLEAGPAEVTLTSPVRFGVHEVTQSQWRAVMEIEPWKSGRDVQVGDEMPATYVNWADARDFCSELTRRERAAGRIPADLAYRLPTEAEWEFACRAGTTTTYWYGDDEAELTKFAWYRANTEEAGESYAHATGVKPPNPWGLHDVHGNVWEWCGDWFGGRLPGGTDPTGPAERERTYGRVVRGGSWNERPGSCRSLIRFTNDPSLRSHYLGFRVVLGPRRSLDSERSSWTNLIEGGKLDAWDVLGDVGWTVDNGVLTSAAQTTETGGGALITKAEYTDYELDFEMRLPRNGNVGPIVDKHQENTQVNIGSTRLLPADQQWHRVRVVERENRLSIEIDTRPSGEHSYAGENRGHVGFRSFDVPVDYRNVRIRPLKRRQVAAIEWVLSHGGRVTVAGRPFGEREVAALDELPAEPFELKYVEFKGGELRDVDLAALDDISPVPFLLLNELPLTDAVAPRLQRHGARWLQMNGTKITSKLVIDLVESGWRCDHLRVRDTAVDDSAVEALITLNPRETLDVRGTKLSREAVERLEAKLTTATFEHDFATPDK